MKIKKLEALLEIAIGHAILIGLAIHMNSIWPAVFLIGIDLIAIEVHLWNK